MEWVWLELSLGVKSEFSDGGVLGGDCRESANESLVTLSSDSKTPIESSLAV